MINWNEDFEAESRKVKKSIQKPWPAFNGKECKEIIPFDLHSDNFGAFVRKKEIQDNLIMLWWTAH